MLAGFRSRLVLFDTMLDDPNNQTSEGAVRRQLSASVSLILIVVGVFLGYYVLHSCGWSWNGPVTFTDAYRYLPMLSRSLVIAGFILSAWGLGSLIRALSDRR